MQPDSLWAVLKNRYFRPCNLLYGIGGAIYANNNSSLSFTGTSNFSINSAMQGGAISANVYSTLTFNGSISFTSNGRYQYTNINGYNHGGAIYLSVGSAFSILPHTTVCWENNLDGQSTSLMLTS